MNEDLPFSEVLTQLFDQSDVAIAQLYRLSDMTPEEMEAVMARWPELPEQRRRVITRHMADISEEIAIAAYKYTLVQKQTLATLNLANTVESSLGMRPF